MNLFIRELKAHRKSLIVWSVVMSIFLYLTMVKYTALAGDAQASQELLKAFPSTIQAIFGMTGLDLTTITGYYGISFIFIAVMLAIHAGMLGAEIVAKEESDKTAEFLYVKPIARSKVLTLKLMAGLAMLLLLFTVTHAATYVSIAAVNNGSVPLKELALFTGALGILQLLFFSLGAAVACILRAPKRAAAITSGIVILSYITYVLQSISPDLSWVKNVSPFAYFSAKDILATLQIDGSYALICGAITLAAITLSYIRYTARDFKV